MFIQKKVHVKQEWTMNVSFSVNSLKNNKNTIKNHIQLK